MNASIYRRCVLCSVVALYGLSPWAVCAQTAPNAGSLAPPTPRPSLPAPLTAPAHELPYVTPTTGPRVTVYRFVFEGNTQIDSAVLQRVVSRYLDRALGFPDLQAAADAVVHLYRDAGMVARAVLPAQDVTEGVITIRIVEAVYAGVTFEGHASNRIDTASIRRRFDTQIKPGSVLNTQTIDRAILLADDLPGVSVDGALRAGQEEDHTELVVRSRDEPLVESDVSSDNQGSRSTGRTRLNANLILNSPLGWGESFTAQAMKTSGTQYVRAAASVPVGVNGWRVGVNTSVFSYRLVAPEFVSLNANGQSVTAGVELSYPIYRARLSNVYFLSTFDHKQFVNDSSGANVSSYASQVMGLGLSANRSDQWLGGGFNSASLTWMTGQIDLTGSPNQSADALGAQTQGHFNKVRYSVSRQQTLAPGWSFNGVITGQVANKNLDSSERFYLGGANGVRAYPSSEGGGAEGSLATLEMRWVISQHYTLNAFHDSGAVRVNYNNQYPGATTLNTFRLSGNGLGLSWFGEKGATVRATVARRIGDNPNATSAGKDQDGSLLRNRVWVSLQVPF